MKMLACVFLLFGAPLTAAEDSATLIQMLGTLSKVLETSQKALNYDKADAARLSLDSWRYFVGQSQWQTEDGSMGLDVIGDMSKLSFRDSNQTQTIGINLRDAIKAIENKSQLNINYSNQALKLQTSSIRNHAEVIRRLRNSAKTPQGSLQAMQTLIRLMVVNLEQIQHQRSHQIAESRYRNNFRAREWQERQIQRRRAEEIWKVKHYPPRPRSHFGAY